MSDQKTTATVQWIVDNERQESSWVLRCCQFTGRHYSANLDDDEDAGVESVIRSAALELEYGDDLATVDVLNKSGEVIARGRVQSGHIRSWELVGRDLGLVNLARHAELRVAEVADMAATARQVEQVSSAMRSPEVAASTSVEIKAGAFYWVWIKTSSRYEPASSPRLVVAQPWRHSSGIDREWHWEGCGTDEGVCVIAIVAEAVPPVDPPRPGRDLQSLGNPEADPKAPS